MTTGSIRPVATIAQVEQHGRATTYGTLPLTKNFTLEVEGRRREMRRRFFLRWKNRAERGQEEVFCCAALKFVTRLILIYMFGKMLGVRTFTEI